MLFRTFGRAGFDVSALGLGCGSLSEDRLVHHALHLGITLFDTARSYGDSEAVLGQALKGRTAIVSTKVGYGIDGVPDWTGPCVTAGVDRALRVLQRDVIDIVHLHSCPIETLQKGEVIDALERAAAAGKIRVAAYSGENDALHFALTRLSSVQLSVNVCDQRAIRSRTWDGIGVIAKRVLANSEPHRDRFSALALPWIGAEEALRFAVFSPGVSAALIGTRSEAHLTAAVRALEKGPLQEREEIEARFDAVGKDWPGII